MKKLLSAFLAVVLALSCTVLFASAQDGLTVNVSIADQSSKLVLAHRSVAVTDKDSDGLITINDALISAHDAHYQGGASQGYATAIGDYGLYLVKLWGKTNGAGFGYYVNNQAAWSLLDVLNDGDNLYAFIYTDTVGFSDSYCFFNNEAATVKAYEAFTVELKCLQYDMASWQYVEKPVEGAVITIDGKATKLVTDASGKAEITLTKQGEHLISASCESLLITPPVCVVSTEKGSIISALRYFINLILTWLRGLSSSIG